MATVAWIGLGLWGLESYAYHFVVYRGFGPPHDPPGVVAGKLSTVKFHSPAIGKRSGYAIYLPPGYAAGAAAGRRYPVLYLLHGAPGWPRLFWNAGGAGVALDTLMSRGRVRPMLIVAPEGEGSWRASVADDEWANTRHGRWESYVLDAVHAVDARFPTIADRMGRALAGPSEGGYAALNVGLHNVRDFATIESWSGYATQTRSGVFRHAQYAELARNSPASYVQDSAMRAALAGHPLHAFVYTGQKDRDRGQVVAFARDLRSAGAHVQLGLFPGRHSWQLWRGRMSQMLSYADARFRAASVAAGPARRVPPAVR